MEHLFFFIPLFSPSFFFLPPFFSLSFSFSLFYSPLFLSPPLFPPPFSSPLYARSAISMLKHFSSLVSYSAMCKSINIMLELQCNIIESHKEVSTCYHAVYPTRNNRPLNLLTLFTVRATPFHSEIGLSHSEIWAKIQDLSGKKHVWTISMCIAYKKEKSISFLSERNKLLMGRSLA